MMVATIEREPTLRVANEEPLFEAPTLKRRFLSLTSGPELIDFDVAPTGDRFLALSPTRVTDEMVGNNDDGSATMALRMIIGWSDEVRRMQSTQ